MTYNGWHNYHTWNIALYISNSHADYHIARKYSQKHGDKATYSEFIRLFISEEVNPDGVSYTDPTLDHDELDAFIRELGEN